MLRKITTALSADCVKFSGPGRTGWIPAIVATLCGWAWVFGSFYFGSPMPKWGVVSETASRSGGENLCGVGR